jgi:PAS domain S-box-containing protein
MSSNDVVDPDGLLRQAPDAIIFADTGGVIRFWNSAATRVFGYSVEQAIGASLDIIIPERFREAHWKGFDRALEEAATKYAGQALATRATRSDGAQIYVELSFAIVVDDDGSVLGALSHARDITERFERDRERQKRIRDLEAALSERA